MEVTLRELAQLLDGELHGPEDHRVGNIKGIEEAGPDDLTFLANQKYAPALARCRAGAVLVSRDQPVPEHLNHIKVDDPYLAFAKCMTFASQKEYVPGGVSELAVLDPSAAYGADVTIHPRAVLGAGVKLGDRVVIHPGVVLGEGVQVGDDTVIYPNVTVYHGCLIGKRCIIHAGAVIGSDGYAFARDGDRHFKIPQLGIVQIDDDVEIGANTTIDRAAMGRTWIQQGVKIDNLVQVAHNVVVGENALLISQVGISGSSKVGKNAILAGQAGVAGHLTIGDGAVISAKCGVLGNIPAGETYSGWPPFPHRVWLRSSALTKRLPELFERLKKLEKKLGSNKGGNS